MPLGLRPDAWLLSECDDEPVIGRRSFKQMRGWWATAALVLVSSVVILPTPLATSSPVINLPPGVVTVLQSSLPNGQPFRLTLQRIRFQGREYVCLAASESGGTTQQCAPLPLPDRPLVAVMSYPTVCSPRPAQLVWGLALTDVTVALRVGGHDLTAARRSIPAALHARGNLFFIWARSAPDSLIARNRSGKVVATHPINSGSVPVFASYCRHHPSLGPSPG
jgi:hypothetical protein